MTKNGSKLKQVTTFWDSAGMKVFAKFSRTSYHVSDTAMIWFSAWAAYFLLVPKGRRLIETGHLLYLGQGAEKRPNFQHNY